MAYPEQFANVIQMLGGMHMLMSFIRSVGPLMADSGLSGISESTYRGVPTIVFGKIHKICTPFVYWWND